jgi:hypothetical protein
MKPESKSDRTDQTNSYLIGEWKIIGGRSDWQGNCRLSSWNDEFVRFFADNKFSWQARSNQAKGEYRLYQDNRIILELDTPVEGTFKFLNPDNLLIHFEDKLTILKMSRIG